MVQAMSLLDQLLQRFPALEFGTLGAYYGCISRGKGATNAVFATARKIGTLLYRMLRWAGLRRYPPAS